MVLFRGYKNIFDSGNIVSISGNTFLYTPQGHPVLYKYSTTQIQYHYKLHLNCVMDCSLKQILGVCTFNFYGLHFEDS